MRLYGTWKVTLPDEQYVWEPDLMTMAECFAVETELVGTEWEVFDDWIRQGISKGRPVACQVLVWFLRYKTGKTGERRDVDFPIRQLELELVPDPKENPKNSKANASSSSSDASGSEPATGST